MPAAARCSTLLSRPGELGERGGSPFPTSSTVGALGSAARSDVFQAAAFLPAGDRPDCALDDIGVDLDAAVVEEASKAVHTSPRACCWRLWVQSIAFGGDLLKGGVCVTTVSIVCTIKAPVPVRAEDVLDPRHVHRR